jgi:hypothetical protein
MRPSCLDCARKHIAEAEVLIRESVMGYPLHAWLSIGHLSQAEAELIKDYPSVAHEVRAERLNLIDGMNYKADEDDNICLELTYNLNTIELLAMITSISIGDASERV